MTSAVLPSAPLSTRPGATPRYPDRILAACLLCVALLAAALGAIDRASGAGGWTVALHSLAGWCHLRSGALAAAETEFRAAADLDAASVDPQVGLGYVRLRRGSPGEAEERFRFARRRDPGNLDALKGLGLALRDEKKYAEAARIFRDALRVKPGDAEVQALLDQALAAGGGGEETRPLPPATGTRIQVMARAQEGDQLLAGPRAAVAVKD